MKLLNLMKLDELDLEATILKHLINKPTNTNRIKRQSKDR